MNVTFLIPYRNRQKNFKSFLNWINELGYKNDDRFKFLIIEQNSTPTIKRECEQNNILYEFVPLEGVFHKTKLLNIGLSLSHSEFIAPFDIDLVPYKNTLDTHLKLANSNKNCLISGYRLMYSEEYLSRKNVHLINVDKCSMAPEDSPSALFKQLVNSEKFGVVPYFNRKSLLKIKGWDESYRGWGAEDQDIIERYTSSYPLVRSSDLTYIHLSHDYDTSWKSSLYTKFNRDYYYSSRKNNVDN